MASAPPPRSSPPPPPSAAARMPCKGRPGRTVDAAAPRRASTGDGLDAAARVDDDDAWERAEDAVVAARSRDKQGELERDHARSSDTLERGRRRRTSQPSGSARESSWPSTASAPARANCWSSPSSPTPPAGWPACSTTPASPPTLLEGAVDHRDRDALQERFLAGQFQVLVSTDAGGEGIDLQSAHVMIDWDIPWSLVRLEQRMGRLHRIGQTNAVHIYHLVAPATREGRVQEVMLRQPEAAGAGAGWPDLRSARRHRGPGRVRLRPRPWSTPSAARHGRRVRADVPAAETCSTPRGSSSPTRTI